MHGVTAEGPTPPNGSENGVLPGDTSVGSFSNVFTEYVDMDCYRRESGLSLDDEDYEGTEEQLLLLFKLGQKKRLKEFMRCTPWPADHLIRHSLWQSMCKHLHKADGNLFEEIEKELFGDNESLDDIPLPSFIDTNHLTPYHLSDRGIHLISRIIAVIHHTSPDITYSPATFSLSSLFLHYMGPSEVFNCMYALLRSKDVTYLTQTRVALEASKLVLRDLAKKYAKSAYVYLVRHSSNTESVFENWLWWIYRDLPFFYLVKVTDCFLIEGGKVLYRVVLAILILFAKYSGKKSSREPSSVNVANNISRFCEKLPVDVNKLLKIAFGIRGLTRKEIRKLQLKHEMYINSRNLLTVNEMPRVASSHSMMGMPVSRSFSGPIILQHIKGTNILTADMITPSGRSRSRSLGVYAFPHLKSCIITQEDLHAIWSWLPPRLAVCQPELLYTSEEHGTSLRTLYSKIEKRQQSLIIIKTTNNEVFGAFCSASWQERKTSDKNLSYFGTGETFIFKLAPVKFKYEWIGLFDPDNIPTTANMFLAGDTTVLTIGGGNGEAIQLDENLVHCRTERCDTFDNDPLCESGDFTCKVVEVFGFQ